MTNIRESPLLYMMFTDETIWEELIKKAHEKDLDKQMIQKLRSPKKRRELYESIKNGTYQHQIPHKAEIPKKDSKEMRVVVVSGDKKSKDRLVFALINECLFKMFGNVLISKQSKAYQKGIGTGDVVKELSRNLCERDNLIVAKYDFSKYFDKVSKESVFAFFALMERMMGYEYGTEPVMNFLRGVWNDNRVKNLDGSITEEYLGIRQGNPCSAFWANVILRELDDYMSAKYPFYVRYSDDLIVLGESEEKITEDINSIICKYGVSLNEKKTQSYTKDDWFKFLGFNCKGDMRSPSKTRVKDFQREILSRTLDLMPSSRDVEQDEQKRIAKREQRYNKSVRLVMEYMYGKPGDEYSWATSLLPVCNVECDLQTLNDWVMDCLREVKCNDVRPHMHRRRKTYDAIGTIGVEMCRKDYTLTRSKGEHVRRNLERGGKELAGYLSIVKAQKAMLMSKEIYETVLRNA